MRVIILLVAVAFVEFAAATASFGAPTPGPSATPEPKQLSGVVVTAQRHQTPIGRTSRQVWILSAADLERLGAATAADALRFVPGTIVQEYGAYGSLATVALRGASTSQTLILINGVPANEPDTGVFDFSTLPASAIDHIEVVQGGSSTLYGSAAMGGVINIFTKEPVSAGSTNISAQWGYRGEFTGAVGVTLGAPDFLGRVDVQTVSSNNEFAYPAYGTLYPAGVRTNDDAKTENTNVSLNGRLGEVLAAATLQNNASNIGSPGSVFSPFGPAQPSGLARQQRVYQRMNLDFNLPLARSEFELQLSSDGRRLHFYDPTPPFSYDTLSNANSRQIALRATMEIGQSNVVTTGYDAGNDTALFDFTFAGVPYGGPPVQCQGIAKNKPCVARDTTSAVYLQDEEHAPNSPVSVSAGVRNEQFAGTKSVSVPSTGAILKLSDAFDLVANYGRAFRNPSLDERYYPGFGNPELLPEYGASFDGGVRARGSHSDFNLAYFGADTNNLIINVPFDKFGDLHPVNVSRARVRGIESSISHDLGHFAHASIAYTDYLRAVDYTLGFSGNRLLYRPSATASASTWVERGTWTYGLDTVFVGRRYADEANTELMRPYVTTSVHLKKRISSRFAVTLQVDNLENNSSAEDVLGYPVTGRAFSIRVSTR